MKKLLTGPLILGSLIVVASEQPSVRGPRDTRELCTFITSIKNIAKVGEGVNVTFTSGYFSHATGVMSSYLQNVRHAYYRLLEVVKAYNVEVDGEKGPQLTPGELVLYENIFEAIKIASEGKQYTSTLIS